MAVFVWRKKPRLSQELEADVLGLFSSLFLKNIMLRVSAAVFLLGFIFICSSSSSSSTIISGHVVHRCVLSRKLNDIYCLSAGSQIPARSYSIHREERAGFGIEIGDQEEAVDTVEMSPVLAIGNSSGEGRKETMSEAYKEIEGQLQIHRSWISDSRSGTCEGRGIYVYQLPSRFNKDLLAQCDDMMPWQNLCRYFSNGGLGEAMEELGRGWYDTHQYTLEPIFHARILKHPCRVYNQDDAKLFYVPYYGGLDVLRWHFKNVSNGIKDSMGMDLIRWLELRGPWHKNSGKDHVFVLGKISWDFRRNSGFSWGSRFLELDEMQNPVKLLIERQPWHANDIGIPHPTHFHPQTDEDIHTWQLKVMNSKRRNMISFAGAARPRARESIRSVLIVQCTSGGSTWCKFLNCSSGQCSKPESIIGLFTESEFCLQPPGDSPTRKSVFDSLVSGCIPVLFDPMTAYYQYPWHLPKNRDKYSVFIDIDEVRNKSVSVVERLMKIPTRERENMRRYIVYEVLPGLVYGDLNSKFEKFEDAFSISINNLLERVGRLKDM